MPRYPTRAPARSSSEAGGVAAVDRALMVLAAWREGDRTLGLSELATRTGFVKSTTLRLLASLQHFGLVLRLEDGRYALGPEISRLHAVYASSFSLGNVVVPALEDLVRRTKESAAFHVRQGEHRLCLYRVDSPQPIRDHAKAGDVFPLDRGAGGRLLMAFSGARSAQYDQIRKDGVVAIVGDRSPELAGISAPVFRTGGELVGAMTLTMPANRFKKSLVPAVKEAAATLSAKLGSTR